MAIEGNIFNVTNHLIRLESIEEYNGFKKSVIWNWEVSIADRGIHYYGLAIERNRGISTDWIEIKSMQPLKEMTDICKKYM